MATIGYKKNGKYFGGLTDNGECYKDWSAWDSGEGVIYISEYALIDLEQGKISEADLWTRESWLDWVRDEIVYYVTDNPKEEFVIKVAEDCLEMCDWQDLSTYLSEIDLDAYYEDLWGNHKRLA